MPAKKETGLRRDGKEYVTAVEHNGAAVSVSDIYCDGYILYYTTLLETDDKGLNRADGISS